MSEDETELLSSNELGDSGTVEIIEIDDMVFPICNYVIVETSD